MLAACQSGFGNPGVPVKADDVQHTFLDLDANRDGTISRGEAQGATVLASNFSRADANGDGALSRYEFNSPRWRPFSHEPD